MKTLDKGEHKVLSSTDGESAFGMEASAKAFQILSSDIYTHKIMAVIREPACNAYDSHVKAGKAHVPFRVHLPTIWEQKYEIEDFGIGLDEVDFRGEKVVVDSYIDDDGEEQPLPEDEVYTYFTGGIVNTYFRSTGDERNDVIGNLGLGFKSPFSYQSQMQVRTRKDGVEYMFSCYIGNDKKPKVNKIHERQTSEPNGVLVTVPVNESDIYRFRTEAEYVFSFFPVRPECNIDLDIDLSQEEVDELENNGYLYTFNVNAGYTQHSVIAVMGNVAYPTEVDFSVLNSPICVNDENVALYGHEPEYLEFDRDDIEYAKNVLGWNNKKTLIIKYDMGDLNFAASREHLSMDKLTTINFYKRFIDVVNQHRREMQELIDQCQSREEAVLTFFKHTDNIVVGDCFRYDGSHMMSLSSLRIAKFEGKKVYENTRNFQSVASTSNKDFLVAREFFEHKHELTGNITVVYADDKTQAKHLQRCMQMLVRDTNQFDCIFYAGCDGFPKELDPYTEFMDIYHADTIKERVLEVDPDFFENMKRTCLGGGGSPGKLESREFRAKLIQNKTTSLFNVDDIGDNDVYVDKFGDGGTVRIGDQCESAGTVYTVMSRVFGLNIYVRTRQNDKRMVREGGMKSLHQWLFDHFHSHVVPFYQYMHNKRNLLSMIMDGENVVYSVIYRNACMDRQRLDTYVDDVVENDQMINKLYQQSLQFTNKLNDVNDHYACMFSHHTIEMIKRLTHGRKDYRIDNSIVGFKKKVEKKITRDYLEYKYPLLFLNRVPDDEDARERYDQHIKTYIKSANTEN